MNDFGSICRNCQHKTVSGIPETMYCKKTETFNIYVAECKHFLDKKIKRRATILESL